MLIEITGSLGSGKTVLTEKVARQLASEGVPVRIVQVGGRLSADPLTIPRALPFAVRYPHLFQLVLRAAARDADSFRTRLALLWNLMRKAGMSERLAQRSVAGVVIWDEGSVHMAHNAFAHIRRPPRPEEVLQFGELVPKPDLLVRVRASSEVALTRVLSRGHKRTDGDASRVASLLTNAERVFCLLAQVDSIHDRTWEIDNDSADLADLDSHVEAIVRVVRRVEETGAR